MTNPNPARVTDALWYLWEQLHAMEPTSQLGGIYAFKSGYHSTRADNQATWPGNYSVVLPEDLEGPSDKAAALDWTFPEAQSADYARIIKYSDRLLRSGQDPNDNRGNVLREFYGQADADTKVEGWDFYYVRPATSDPSHLWHIHFSFLRKHVTSRAAMDDVLAILTEGDEGMTPSQAEQFDDLIWREDAAASGSLTIRGGRYAGEPYALNVTLAGISTQLEQIAATPGGGSGPSSADIAAAVRPVVRDELDKTKLAG